MSVGIITGTGTYALPDFADPEPQEVATRFGPALLTRGRFAGVEVIHCSRHGEGHRRLSSHVTHQANFAALKELGATCVVSLTACGALEPELPLGSLIVFDDLHFPSNRLPDGSLCSLYTEPGEPERGHWIYDRPYSETLRRALLEGAAIARVRARDGGCYGHVDGPRFNTRTEIAALAATGVTAVSQTGGPETVLAGEAELPMALMGYATDYANAIGAEPTPVEELVRLMGESTGAFAAVLTAAVPRIAESEIAPTGMVYRFEE